MKSPFRKGGLAMGFFDLPTENPEGLFLKRLRLGNERTYIKSSSQSEIVAKLKAIYETWLSLYKS